MIIMQMKCVFKKGSDDSRALTWSPSGLLFFVVFKDEKREAGFRKREDSKDNASAFLVSIYKFTIGDDCQRSVTRRRTKKKYEDDEMGTKCLTFCLSNFGIIKSKMEEAQK